MANAFAWVTQQRDAANVDGWLGNSRFWNENGGNGIVWLHRPSCRLGHHPRSCSKNFITTVCLARIAKRISAVDLVYLKSTAEIARHARGEYPEDRLLRDNQVIRLKNLMEQFTELLKLASVGIISGVFHRS